MNLTDTNAIAERLRSAGVQPTSQRLKIASLLLGAPQHLTAEQILVSLQGEGVRVSKATVYNTLELLEDCFLVKRHQFGKNISQYEKSYPNRQHDHLVCTDCQRVVEFCDPRIYAIQKMVEEKQHFRVMHHSLTFYACCNKPECEHFVKKEVPETEKQP